MLVFNLVDLTNKSFNDKAPWKLIKSGEMDAAKECLYETLEIIRNVTVLISPFIPETAIKMHNQLGYDKLDNTYLWDEIGWGSPRFKVNLGSPIFPRIEIK